MKYLTKANENRLIAELAAQSGHYNVATSRYYYSLYLKGLYIQKNHPIPFTCQGQDSHVIMIKFLIAATPDRRHKQSLQKLMNLKSKRVTADYEDKLITKKEFEDNIKPIFLEVDNVLNSYI